MGPLTGIKVIELGGIGPGPYAGQLLADMGAEVISVTRPGAGLIPGADEAGINERGKKSLVLNLRKPGASQIILDLINTADVLIEGNRPGVTERLGVGPKDCHAVNPKLVYGRMTGWGQTGPWASMAGHDINYISITGALHAMGKDGTPPPIPINFVGDYGGGSLFLTNGILAALLQAERTGKGDVVDAAIIDGVSSMAQILYGMHAKKFWQPKRGANMLDGGAPFYRCYTAKDGEFMAIGCIEPQFFALMLELLEIKPEDYGHQLNIGDWPRQNKLLEDVFASKTRDDWTHIFDGSDACVTPVLTYLEAAEHKQNKARGGLRAQDGLIHPRTAPVFETRGLEDPAFDLPAKGSDNHNILSGIGMSEAQIESLIDDGVVSGPKTA